MNEPVISLAWNTIPPKWLQYIYFSAPAENLGAHQEKNQTEQGKLEEGLSKGNLRRESKNFQGQMQWQQQKIGQLRNGWETLQPNFPLRESK